MGTMEEEWDPEVDKREDNGSWVMGRKMGDG